MTNMLKIEVADDKNVALPIDKKVLGDFISGLLGQPQTLERVLDSAFSIDQQWLIHISTLILQRVQQQNAPEPLAFEAVISYKDGVQRKISSLPAFQHFTETQNLISTGVRIHIALLIQFPGKSVPEKQELILEFDTNEASSSLLENLIARSLNVGKIRIELRHTERTWADDLFRLIEDELNHVRTIELRLKNWLRKAYFPTVIFLFPISMFGTLFFRLWSQKQSETNLLKKISDMLTTQSLDIQSLDSKINLLLANALHGIEERSGFELVFISPILVPVIVFISGVFLARPAPSFVVLSKAAEKHKTITMERLKRKNFLLLLSIVGSIVLGVLGNFVYDKIK